MGKNLLALVWLDFYVAAQKKYSFSTAKEIALTADTALKLFKERKARGDFDDA